MLCRLSSNKMQFTRVMKFSTSCSQEVAFRHNPFLSLSRMTKLFQLRRHQTQVSKPEKIRDREVNYLLNKKFGNMGHNLISLLMITTYMVYVLSRPSGTQRDHMTHGCRILNYRRIFILPGKLIPCD